MIEQPPPDRPVDPTAGTEVSAEPPEASEPPDSVPTDAPPAASPTGSPPDTPPAGDGDGELPVEGDGYRVHLESFDGPLDLLLFLIKRDEVDITDIPIAHITEQYLASIRDVESLDLDRAGEFVLMASTLMRIKAKMLIPRDPEDEDDEDAIDPRAELVRRLLEYREFKRIAEGLGEREQEWRGIFRRASAPLPEVESEEMGDLGVSLVDLLRAFREVLDRVEAERPFSVDTEEYAVSDQMDFVRQQCARHPDGVPFRRLFEAHLSRALVITTFLAILELIREREIVANQVDRFGEIWLNTHTEAAHTDEL